MSLLQSTNARFVAAQIIVEVTNGKSLTDSLDRHLSRLTDARDRAFVQAICYGVCRFYTHLDAILNLLLEKPMPAKEALVHALLFVGLYQLIYMRVPQHAAVTETVNAAQLTKKPFAKGLVNAVLRNFIRKQNEIANALKDDEEAQYAHDGWWIRAIKKAWPNDWQAILKANNEHPPFAIRVHPKVTRDAYVERLRAHDLSAEPIPFTESGLSLFEAVPVLELPGFKEGEVFVQDGAAQMVAPLLELASGQNVLDACAAPGGKLTQILQADVALAKVVAIEKDELRLAKIVENVELHSPNRQSILQLICADAKRNEAWSDQTLFDRILVDAPCSASGVIRRHPDIKLLREQKDIRALAQEQQQILRALWPLLTPNGLLLYVTCSIFPEENTDVIAKFLSENDDALAEKIDAEWGIETQFGRQILPGQHGMDGFYFAKLRKNSK